MPEPFIGLVPAQWDVPLVAPPDGRVVHAAGLDLIDVGRLRLAVDRSGPRLLDRLFDERERAACADGADAVTMAGLFGIKESIVKTIGGLPAGAAFRDIAIDTSAGASAGDPAPVGLRGVLADWAAARGVRTVAGHGAAADGLVVSWALAIAAGDPC